jgi:hypothetical protein
MPQCALVCRVRSDNQPMRTAFEIALVIISGSLSEYSRQEDRESGDSNIGRLDGGKSEENTLHYRRRMGCAGEVCRKEAIASIGKISQLLRSNTESTGETRKWNSALEVR